MWIILLTKAKLIPTAFSSLTDPCLPDLLTDKYPAMPGVIMMAALLALFVLELVLKAKTGGHSHGGPTGEHLHSHPQANNQLQRGLANQGAPMGASLPPMYRPDTAMSDDFRYIDEKKYPYVR
jgi:hypothetical protein